MTGVVERPLKYPTNHDHNCPLFRCCILGAGCQGAECFEFVDFSVPEDRDIVRNLIVEKWGTIEDFNARILATIGSALDLTQVSCLLYVCFIVIRYFEFLSVLLSSVLRRWQ